MTFKHVLKWCVVLAASLVTTVAWAQSTPPQDEPQLIMPPGYALQRIDAPRPSPDDFRIAIEKQLVFLGPDRLVYRLDLDFTPARWLEGLLEITVGDRTPWSPASRYQVYPLGLPAHPGSSPGSFPESTTPNGGGFNFEGASGGQAIAILGDRLLVLDGNFRQRPDAELKALYGNHATLQFDGVDLLLKDFDTGRRYRFSLPPAAAQPPEAKPSKHNDVPMAPPPPRWRLAQTGWLRTPSSNTTLIYSEDGNLKTIRLPNDLKLPVETADGWVTRIDLPFHQAVAFERDASGRITELSTYRGGELGESLGRRDTAMKFVYDDNARLAEIQLPDRVTWTVEYSDPVSSKDRPPVTTWDARVRCSADKGYLFNREVITPDPHVWSRKKPSLRNAVVTVVQGSATDGQLMDVAVEAYRHTAHDYVVDPMTALPGYADTLAARGRSWWLPSTYPHSREPVERAFTFLRNTASQPQMSTASAIKKDGVGRVTSQTINDVVYTYDYAASGELVQATVADSKESYRFATDDWGRIVREELPNKQFRQWVYNDDGQLLKISQGEMVEHDFNTSVQKKEEASAATLLSYDREGRLERVDFTDGRRWRIDYDSSGRIRMFRDTSAGEERYRYDRLGRLSRVDQVNQGWTGYDYRLDGLIAKREDHPRNDRSKIVLFDPQNRIISEAIQGMGETRYEYDEKGRQSHIIHPDGKDTLYTYDDLNRVIKVRGSHQPPVDITYDKNGGRTVTTPTTPEAGGAS